MASVPVMAVVYAILSVGLALLAGGLVGLLQWLRVRRAGVADGPTHLTGLARPIEGRTVSAPAADAEALCAAWELQARRGGADRPSWTTVAEGTATTNFTLQADEGDVRVEPRAARFDLGEDFLEEIDGRDALPDAVAEAAGPEVSMADDEFYRLVEGRLAVDDPVSVTGRVASAAEGSPVVDGPADSSYLARLLGVPFVIADPDRGGGLGVLRDRAITGFVFGLPPTLLALVLLFPP